MAIISFVKCFGPNKARTNNLDINDVLAEDTQGKVIYLDFKNLRNKNIAHDENSILQCLPGAIINKKEAPHKIEKIITFNLQGITHDEASIDNLRELIGRSGKYVESRYDKICKELTDELEKMSHEELTKMKQMHYSIPKRDEVAKKREKLKD